MEWRWQIGSLCPVGLPVCCAIFGADQGSVSPRYVYHEQMTIRLSEVSGQSSYAPVSQPLAEQDHDIYVHADMVVSDQPSLPPPPIALPLRLERARSPRHLALSSVCCVKSAPDTLRVVCGPG
eukprot:580439-Rhodomonas_salina.1